MKLAIVGLDGLSPNMIRHCRDDLPVLDRLLSEGAGGDLRSTVPAVTFPAWTTFTTGKDPGSHGLYNMTELDGEYALTPGSVNETEGALYDIVDDSVFINVPATYPRQPAGDALLATGSAPSAEAALPPEWQDWPEADDYRINPDGDEKGDTERYLADQKEIAAARFAITRRAVEEHDPVLLFTLFSSTDWLFHHLEPGNHEAYITELLTMLDQYLGWFEEEADNLLVMSDHGFEHKDTAAYPNQVLEAEGLVKTKTTEEANTGWVAVANLIRSVTSRSDLAHELVRRTYNRLSHTEVAEELYEAKELDIDYQETVAWHTQRGTVFINDDRFGDAQVAPDEYDEIIEAVRTALDEARHPETGKSLFASVSTGESLYGDGAGIRPDVVAEPADGVILYQSPMQEKAASSTDIFNHRTEGILAATGEAFTGASLDADIRDLAPTVLHLLGRPVPSDMDGRVLAELLATDRAVEEGDPIQPGPVGAVEEGAETELEQRLVDLGYME